MEQEQSGVKEVEEVTEGGMDGGRHPAGSQLVTEWQVEGAGPGLCFCLWA